MSTEKSLEYSNNNIDEIINAVSIKFNKSVHPTLAFIFVNTRLISEPIEVNQQDVFNMLKNIVKENNIKHPLSDSTFRKIAKEITLRVAGRSKPFKVLIAKGKEVINGKNGKVIWYFQKYNPAGAIKEDGKIDFKEKHFITAVKQGAVLLEIIKPTDGKSGYDIFDNVVPPTEGTLIGDLDKWDYNPKTIAKEDKGDRIIYTAKKEGALVFKLGAYSVDNLVAIKNVNMARTGNIDASLNKDVVIKVGRDDVSHFTDDVIYPKMHVRAKNVTINGNVGSHAVIEAEEVEVNGTIQMGAEVIAKKVTARTCRGIIRAESVKLDLAEHADLEVKGHIEIKTAISSKLSAENAFIHTMLNLNKITVAYTITANSIIGESNIITINPIDLWWLRERYKELKSILANTFAEMDNKKKHYESLSDVFKKSQEKYRKLKILIRELTKKEKTKNLETMIKDLKETKKIMEAFNSAKTEYDELKRKTEELKKEIKKIKDGYEQGSVIINEAISQGNKIVFGKDIYYVVENPMSYIQFILSNKHILSMPFKQQVHVL